MERDLRAGGVARVRGDRLQGYGGPPVKLPAAGRALFGVGDFANLGMVQVVDRVAHFP